MTDSTISALADAGALQSGDKFVIERGALTNRKKGLLGYPELVYRYTVTGSDKASIDTGVDTPDAGTNDWTNGDLLEVWIVARTDDAAATANVAVTLNNDSGTNYLRQNVRGLNTAVSASATTAGTSWSLPVHGSGGSANIPGVVHLALPDFAGTVFDKPAEVRAGTNDASAGNNISDAIILTYLSTLAITRLAVAAATGGAKLKVGSQLLIYKRIAA